MITTLSLQITGEGETMDDRSQDSHWSPDWGFIEALFTEVLGECLGRKWMVATLLNGDVDLRDAYALLLLKERLHGWRTVTYRYVRAWATEVSAPLPPDVDLLFIG